MDSRIAAKEFGFFEACLNLEKVMDSKEVKEQAGADMPLPDGNVAKRIQAITSWLNSFGKTRYMFLTPELALIDELAKLSKNDEMIITIPHDMEPEVRKRLQNNLPKEINTSLLEEPFTLKGFYPSNSIIVICGYLGGGRPMVMYDTYRMAAHYSRTFYGRIVFVPFADLDSAVRYNGWRELDRSFYNTEWRGDI